MKQVELILDKTSPLWCRGVATAFSIVRKNEIERWPIDDCTKQRSNIIYKTELVLRL